jgi:hypothetical protein
MTAVSNAAKDESGPGGRPPGAALTIMAGTTPASFVNVRRRRQREEPINALREGGDAADARHQRRYRRRRSRQRGRITVDLSSPIAFCHGGNCINDTFYLNEYFFSGTERNDRHAVPLLLFRHLLLSFSLKQTTAQNRHQRWVYS